MTLTGAEEGMRKAVLAILQVLPNTPESFRIRRTMVCYARPQTRRFVEQSR